MLVMSENVNICAVCKIPASQQCAGCKSVYYCNKEHQKQHWKDGHKNNCAPYKIVALGTHDRKLVAARDIKQNEVILKESPLILAPPNLTFATCLGCNVRIQDQSNNVYRCTNCNWPLCEKKCQDSVLHRDECKIMRDNNFTAGFTYNSNEKIEAYSVIPTLRGLLLKSNSKTKYLIFTSLKSRLHETKSTPAYVKMKANLVPFIQDVLKLNFTEDEILNTASIIEENSFEIVKEEGDIKIRGLYPTASFLKHDCRPNTKHLFYGENMQLILIATVPIRKGEIITTTFAETLWGTLARRAHLKEEKHIDCECKRCSDRTELDTYLGAIFCSMCKKPKDDMCPKMLSTDPLNPSAMWKCENCEHTIPGRQMAWGNNAIKSEISKLDKRNPLNLEQFIVKYQETLHPKNYHNLVIKYALSQMYGNMKGYSLSVLTDTILERKIDLCHELLEIVDVLDPGFSKVRGSLLYDLQATMVVQAKQAFNTGKITKTAAQETLAECLVIMKEAIEILSSDPDMKDFLQNKLECLINELDFD